LTKRVTLKQVAAHADVSYQTVSRVINRMPDVAPSTRARVQSALRDLNYRPRPLAGIFAKRSSPVIGVVIPFEPDTPCPHSYYTKILHGIGLEVTLHDGSVLLSSSISTGVPLSYCHRVLEERNLDGLILDETVGEDGAQLFIDAGYPIIILGYPKNSGFPSIHLDDEGRAYKLTQHLFETNHRRIGTIYNPNQPAMQAQMRGFERAFKEKGYAWSSDLCMMCDGLYPEEGYRAVAKLMTHPEPPTAICSFSSSLALSSIRWFMEFGHNIPGEVTIACLDEITNMEFFQVPVITIQQFQFELGRRAAAILLDLIRGHTLNDMETVVPGSLIMTHSHPTSTPNG
jgi:DNA-binding LacI/PurR family transcriptional regulator